MASTQTDIGSIETAAIQALTVALAPVIEGAQSDLQAYAAGIITDAIAAGTAGDTDTLAQLKDQQMALLEVNRLRIVSGASTTVTTVINAVLSLALKLAAGIAIA